MPRGEFAPEPSVDFRAPVQGSAKVAVARMREQGEGMTDQEQWYAGVDWASESHHVFLTDSGGQKIGERIFKHGGEGLAAMAAWLMTESGAGEPSQVQIAIEVPWACGGNADRARLQGAFDQPEADRSLP